MNTSSFPQWLTVHFLTQRISLLSKLHIPSSDFYKSFRSSNSVHINVNKGDLGSIYTSTFGIIFYGTPHHGTSQANLLGILQKLAVILVPKAIVQFESSLLKALEEESETLQNITDQFTPLMNKFHLYCLWEGEKTDLKKGKEYIVEEWSAVPIMPDVGRSGIPANHRMMCRFKDDRASGFRNTMSTLRRWSQQATGTVQNEWAKDTRIFNENRRHEALELLQTIQPSSTSDALEGRSQPYRALESSFKLNWACSIKPHLNPVVKGTYITTVEMEKIALLRRFLPSSSLINFHSMSCHCLSRSGKMDADFGHLDIRKL